MYSLGILPFAPSMSFVVYDFPFEFAGPSGGNGDFPGRGGYKGLGASVVEMEVSGLFDISGEAFVVGLLEVNDFTFSVSDGAPHAGADHSGPESDAFGGGVCESFYIPRCRGFGWCQDGDLMGHGRFCSKFGGRRFSVLWARWIWGDLGSDLLLNGRYLLSDRVDRISGSL